jgi:SWI/SNF-related matrix-associated actin-dependent regulator of chromatin subfamily A3
MFRGTRITPGKDKIMSVDIVIYGSPEIRKTIGHLLSSARIYLQHPYHQDPNTDYDNPHFLKRTDLSIASALPTPASGSRAPLNDSDPPLIPTGEPSQDLIEGKAHQTKLDKVFSSLTRYKTLKRLKADIKITTPLLQ